MLEKEKKIVVFIDAGNLWSSYREMGKLLNFNKFHYFFADKFKGKIFKIFYYVAFPESDSRPKIQIDRFHKFLIFLKKGLNFNVIKKPLKTIFLRNQYGELNFDHGSGTPKSIEKGNFDVEITIDAIRYSTAYDTAIFFTGDSDFLPLIRYLKKIGNGNKKVYIFSTNGCISRELRTGADGYYNIEDYPEILGEELINKK